MAPKVLILLAVVCAFQYGASAASVSVDNQLQLTNKRLDVFDFDHSVENRGIITCLSHLWEAFTVVRDVFYFVRETNRIRSALKEAVEKCKKLGNEGDQEKCRTKVEEDSRKRWEKLVADYNLFARAVSLVGKFATCYFT